MLEHKYLEPPFIILAPWFIAYYHCTTSFSKVWTMVPRRFKSCLRRVGGLLWRELMTVVPAGNNTKPFLLVNHSAKQFIVYNLLPLQPLPLGSFYLCEGQYEWVKFIFVKAIGHLSSIFWNAETWMLYFILGKIKYVIRNMYLNCCPTRHYYWKKQWTGKLISDNNKLNREVKTRLCLPSTSPCQCFSAFCCKWLEVQKRNNCSKLTIETLEKVWNTFRVNNIYTETMSLTSFGCLYYWLWTYFTLFPSVFIVDFQQVNVCWEVFKQS